ncbi:MAG: hypothetical protein ACYC5X_13940, partial [Syntrophales bacterium]
RCVFVGVWIAIHGGSALGATRARQDFEVQAIADPDAATGQPKIGEHGEAQIIPAWIAIEGHRQIHHDPHADSTVGDPYPPLQAFVHEDIGSRTAIGLNNGPWSVNELPDIIIVVIHRLHIHFYTKPGL